MCLRSEPRWHPAHRTNGNLSVGKNCQIEVDATSVNLQVAPVAALVTSRRWTPPKERFASLRKCKVSILHAVYYRLEGDCFAALAMTFTVSKFALIQVCIAVRTYLNFE